MTAHADRVASTADASFSQAWRLRVQAGPVSGGSSAACSLAAVFFCVLTRQRPTMSSDKARTPLPGPHPHGLITPRPHLQILGIQMLAGEWETHTGSVHRIHQALGMGRGWWVGKVSMEEASSSAFYLARTHRVSSRSYVSLLLLLPVRIGVIYPF